MVLVRVFRTVSRLWHFGHFFSSGSKRIGSDTTDTDNKPLEGGFEYQTSLLELPRREGNAKFFKLLFEHIRRNVPPRKNPRYLNSCLWIQIKLCLKWRCTQIFYDLLFYLAIFPKILYFIIIVLYLP